MGHHKKGITLGAGCHYWYRDRRRAMPLQWHRSSPKPNCANFSHPTNHGDDSRAEIRRHATMETRTKEEEKEGTRLRREECNFSPIDESPLQNDSTSGALLVAAVLFAATSATYYVVAALTRPSEEGSGCKLGAKNRHHFPSTKNE